MPEEKKIVTSEPGEGSTGLFRCEQNNILGYFIRKCLDTNVTGKLLGMLVISLLGFALLLGQNTYSLTKIEGLTVGIKEQSLPQYKISQYFLRSLNGFKISLLNLLYLDEVNIDDKNILANNQRLELLNNMLVALKQGGTMMDVAKVSQQKLDVITVAPTLNPEINGLVDEIGEQLNISTNTGRAHLRSIFAKTGVTQQTQLVSLILRSVANLG